MSRVMNAVHSNMHAKFDSNTWLKVGMKVIRSRVRNQR